jgi:hypothetical protein
MAPKNLTAEGAEVAKTAQRKAEIEHSRGILTLRAGRPW